MPPPLGPLLDRPERICEFLLAVWMKLLDPNVLGVRRVDEAMDGEATAVLHIAIPLSYGRKELARAVGIKELAQPDESPRINLSSSAGFNEPHSFIRARIDDIMEPFCEYMVANTATEPVVNDQTLQFRKAVAAVAHAPEARQIAQPSGRLQSAIIQAMALRNAALAPDQIEILMDGKTGEQWIRILRLDAGLQSVVHMAIRQAGIRTAPQNAGASAAEDWMVLFPAAEARKLMVEM